MKINKCYKKNCNTKFKKKNVKYCIFSFISLIEINQITTKKKKKRKKNLFKLQ